jgi:hypothetical protein
MGKGRKRRRRRGRGGDLSVLRVERGQRREGGMRAGGMLTVLTPSPTDGLNRPL